MKSALCLILGYLAPALLFAQQKTEYSLIKLKNGESFNVIIQDVEGYRGVSYRFEPSGKTTFVDAESILEYYFNERKFVSKKIQPTSYELRPLNMGGASGYGATTSNYLVVDSSEVFESKWYVLEVLKPGRATLYKLHNFNGYDEYFLETAEGGMVEIPLDYYKINFTSLTKAQLNATNPNVFSNVHYTINRPLEYIRVLKDFLGQHPAIHNMPDYEFSENLLIYITAIYNGESPSMINATLIPKIKSKAKHGLGLLFSPALYSKDIDKTFNTPSFGLSAFLYKPIKNSGNNTFIKYGINQMFLKEDLDASISYTHLQFGLDHYLGYKKSSPFLAWNVGLAYYNSYGYKGIQLPLAIELGAGFELPNSRLRVSAGMSSLVRNLTLFSYYPFGLSFIF